MIHYNLLKLKDGADAKAVFDQCREVYAQLEKELDFLHDACVSRCVTQRDSNADIMMVMQIDSPDRLGDYLGHPMHTALAQSLKDAVEARMSFDAE